MIKNRLTLILNSKVFSAGKNLTSHPFFAGSAIMIIGSNLANFLAYIYHLIVGRLLGPAPYGELVAFISIVGIVTITFNFLGLVIVKYSAALEDDESNAFLRWLSKNSLIAGIIGSILLIFVSPFISSFLHMENRIVVFLAPLFLLYLMSFVYRSYLQGKLRFKEVVLTINLDMGGRLIFGVIFILLGLSVIGAVIGSVVATLLAFILIYFYIRNYLRDGKRSSFSQKRDVFKYSIPVMFSAVSSYLLITTDVLMVKHFFPPHEAGLYAAISTMGKIIFYGTGPISAVMFPLVSKRHSKGYGHKKILLFSLLLTIGMGALITLSYYLVPELMISILYGSEFVEASPNLFRMGVFLSIFAVASLLLNYFISIERTRVVYFAVAAAIMQMISLYFYHDNVIQVINISMLSTGILLVVLIITLISNFQRPNHLVPSTKS